MSAIIGRKSEIEQLERLYNSDRPEFVAVYGRRRVGKTFLIKQVMKDRITFQHTGVSPIDLDGEKKKIKTQLQSFYFSLLNHGLEGYKQPQTWLEAFFQLEQLIKQNDKGTRQVIFLDELPWLDTPKSGFLSAFESFWNGWCSGRDNIMLIVCGSATSWILSNLSRNKGGLYGRLTYEMKLSPFTLKECEDYFEHNQIQMSRYDIVQSYMIFGGIPYYLNYYQKGLSFEQNADQILYGRKPLIKDEFNKLFNAIFSNPEDCKKVIRLLAQRHSGYSREEISQATGLPIGGGLSATLSALCESDFIIRYVPYGNSSREEQYKLIDNFCLFWLKYVESNNNDGSFVTENITSDIMDYWKGVAFEEVCFNHIDQIKNALKISGVKSKTSAWSIKGSDNNPGAQCDLIIVRDDNVINLCEMKFTSFPFSIDFNEDQKLKRRIAALKETLTPKQRIHLTMVSTYGIEQNKYSGAVQKSITMDDLFA